MTDEDSNDTISIFEWDAFNNRFGPLESSFDKVKGEALDTVTGR